MDKLLELSIKTIGFHDRDYPNSLKNIYDPPKRLFVRGVMPCLDLAIGVVGTRQITEYGKKVTSYLVTGLARAGFVIVSGMALGVDAIAHETAIKCGGKTVAVLGAGVDICYPKVHEKLYETIYKYSGAVVSEWGPGIITAKEIFPTRNRIISGLSGALLITEAGIHSGSMITAKYALDQGKSVFVVPGPINSPTSEGCNYLISQGATPVTGAEDLLGYLKGDNHVGRGYD